MSWSASTPTPITKDQIPQIAPPSYSEPATKAAQNDQFIAARRCAAQAALQVGGPKDKVRVSLSGHCTADRRGNESITVAVSVDNS